MSEITDAEKIRAALEELEPWADEEIRHLVRQFEARRKSVYVPYRMSSRISFIGGFFCGLIAAGILLYWFYTQLCSL
jgi:hypothetical protein